MVVLNYLKSGHYSCENKEETASGVTWVMENNSFGHNFARALLHNCFSIFLVAFLFVLGLTDARTAVAASTFSQDKLVGTYKLISVDDSIRDKKGSIPPNLPRVITVYKGKNGEIGITSSNARRELLVKIDPKTGKGMAKDGLIVRNQGKVTSKHDVSVVFKELGGGKYSCHMLGLNYQKTSTGVAGPASSSATKKADTDKQTADKKVKNKSGQPVEKSGDEGSKQTLPTEDSGDKGSTDTDEEEQDDLPESDAGKAAAAVGTAVVGGLLGGAVGSAGGAAGSAGGGYGPSEDGYGLDEDDYGQDDRGYGPSEYVYGSDEGNYGPDEGDKETLPDNLAVADDGSIRVTAPTGEEMVYTRNEDGTYNIPIQTETGENLTWQDEDGNFHTVEPGTVSKEDILEGAKWYKDHERELLADRAAEDARQQAERDRLAAENAKWLEKERLVNSHLSQTSI